MKVKELSEILKKANPEAEINIRYPDFENDYNLCDDIGKIEIYKKEIEIYTNNCWKEI